MRRVISVDEKEFYEINKQGIPYTQLFYTSEWESNSNLFDVLKGAVLISAFVQGEKYRLFFRNPEGEMVRMKLPGTYFGIMQLHKLVCKEKDKKKDCRWVPLK